MDEQGRAGRSSTHRFMFSVDEGRKQLPVGTSSGLGCHDLMRSLVCALPNVANVRVVPCGVNAAAEPSNTAHSILVRCEKVCLAAVHLCINARLS